MRNRKSYWSGCIKVAIAICQQNFLILALVIFLLKGLSKSASIFLALHRGPVLEPQFLCKSIPVQKFHEQCESFCVYKLLCVKAFSVQKLLCAKAFVPKSVSV